MLKNCPWWLVLIVLGGYVWGSDQNHGKQVANLEAFAKLYGYIRYFHPSDEASDMDWDTFAVYGVHQVMEMENPEKLLEQLRALFYPIAPTIAIYPQGTAAPKRRMDPKMVPKDSLQIAWQHYGVGGGHQSIYQSIRTNRALQEAQTGSTFFQTLKVDALRGKDIKLVAWINCLRKEKEANAHAWLTIRKPENKTRFLKAEMNDLSKLGQWQQVSVETFVEPEATHMFLGGLADGDVDVLFDSFSLSVKSEEGIWKDVPLGDDGFEAPAVKESWQYYQPVHQLKLVSHKAYAGKQALRMSKSPSAIQGQLFDNLPGQNEVLKKPLGSGLVLDLPLMLHGDETQTFGRDDDFPLKDLKQAMTAFTASLGKPHDRAKALAAVVIAWNVFQHFYPYGDVIQCSWQTVLPEYLGKMMAANEPSAYLKTIRGLVTELEDGHGMVTDVAARQSGAYLPLVLEKVEGQVVVIRSDDPQLQPGDIIKAMNGIAIETLVPQAEANISGTPQWKSHQAMRRELGHGKKGTTCDISILRNGAEKQVAVKYSEAQYPAQRTRPEFEALAPDIFYVDLDRISIETLREHLPELAAAKGVIFDLRGYPKGNHEILQHLTDKPLQSAIWNVSQIVYPDRDRVKWDSRGRWNLLPLSPRIQGTCVFLTDGRAISYAESVLGIVEAYQLGEIVGQPTAGANGNINHFRLPFGWIAVWTGMKVLKHDGSQHHLIGIQPTIPTSRTINGVQAGRDEFVEKALEMINNKP